MSGGDWALIILAVSFGVLVLFLGLVLVNLFRLLESVKMMVDGVRTETVPLLGEVRITVQGVNRQLDNVEGMVHSAGNITRSVERLSSVVENTVSSPLIKMAAFGAGASRFFRRLRGD